MAYMSAREMLSGLPVKMANGGDVKTYGDFGATAQDLQNAAVNVRAQIAAGTYNPTEAYAEIMASSISVDDALDALGDTPETRALIDQIFTAPADTPAYGGPAPTATMSAGVQDYYNTVMADDQIDAAERLEMQKIATDQGLSYDDILAAGVDRPACRRAYRSCSARPCSARPSSARPSGARSLYPDRSPLHSSYCLSAVGR